jgi:hypothetical protein
MGLGQVHAGGLEASGGPSHQEEKQFRGHGIEGAGVPDLLAPSPLPHCRDYVERRTFFRFVHGQDRPVPPRRGAVGRGVHHPRWNVALCRGGRHVSRVRSTREKAVDLRR